APLPCTLVSVRCTQGRGQAPPHHSPASATCPEGFDRADILRSHPALPNHSPSVSNGDLRCPSAATSAAKALGFRRSQPFVHGHLRCVLYRASMWRATSQASRAADQGSARERPQRLVQTVAARRRLHLALTGGYKCKRACLRGPLP